MPEASAAVTTSWRSQELRAARAASVPRRLRALEPVVCLALGGHAVAVGLASGLTPLSPVTLPVAVAGGLGLAGVLGWRGRLASAVRAASVVVLALAMLALGVDGSEYFVLWFFVAVTVYPLVLPRDLGRVLVPAVPAAYLVLVPFGAADGPPPVALLRATSLFLLGVFVLTAAGAYRRALGDRDGALAILDTYVSATPVGLAFWDDALVLRRANGPTGEALGMPVAQLLGSSAAEVAVADPVLAVNLHRVLTTGAAVQGVEVARGDRVWTSSFYPVRAGGSLLGVGGVLVEVTEQRRAERALTHSATHDALTGLPNRTLFADRVQVSLARSARTGGAVAVLFCDVDRFKVVNDSLGHGAGDELLRATAERLLTLVRDGDTVARLGGDEFALLCTEVADVEDARQIGERVCAAMREPLRVRDRLITSTMSVGVTFHRTGPRDVAGLLRDADVAMYQAKDAGRDQAAVVDTRLRSSADERFHFHAALRRAVEEESIAVHYQPVVPLRPGTGGSAGVAVGFEALARWDRPGHGPVPPSLFIPTAEDLGLIHPLGEHVLRTACRAVLGWREETGLPVTVAVNLSARQLAGPTVVGTVAAVLAETGLPASALHLEITESVLMVDVEHSLTRLGQLHDLGVGIAVDDFGTGYSSLAYLRDLPVDVLKIDRSFTARLPGDAAMFAFIVDLARAVGATTVVEGVETAEQLEAVRAAGCDTAQGFFLARPMPHAEAGAWLREAAVAAR